jgi:hypothetical protein
VNLHQIVQGAIGTVNPPVECMLQRSAGVYVRDDFTPVPRYGTPEVMPCQIQSLTYDELKMLDSLNIQGVRRAIYLNGYWAGVIRPDQRGGDLVIDPEGNFWLVVHALESWRIGTPEAWSKIAVTQQMAQAVLPVDEGFFILGTP